MNYIWTITVALSLVMLTVTNPQSALSVCVDSGAQALKTSLELCGVYCLWLGVFQIAEDCHVVEKFSQLLAPINKLLYGKVNKVAQNYISLNFASNLLGIGNAATPSAIATLKQTEQGDTLSFAGTMLFVVNASGVQLIPTTVIGMRASLLSQNPSDILLPNFITTLVTSVVGVLLVFLLCKQKHQNSGKALKTNTASSRKICAKKIARKEISVKK